MLSGATGPKPSVNPPYDVLESENLDRHCVNPEEEGCSIWVVVVGGDRLEHKRGSGNHDGGDGLRALGWGGGMDVEFQEKQCIRMIGVDLWDFRAPRKESRVS